MTSLSLKTDVGGVAPRLVFRPSVPEPTSEKREDNIPWKLWRKIKNKNEQNQYPFFSSPL